MRKVLRLFLLAFAVSFFTHNAMAQSWPVTKVATSSALWPNTSLYDGNYTTVWTSNGYADPNHQEWLAYWFDGFHPVDTVRLYPRFVNKQVVGFPTSFNVYWSDGSKWNLAQTYANVPMPQTANYVTLKLPMAVNANGIQVVANQLGRDDVGGYYFQISEVGAGLTTESIATDYFRQALPGSPVLTLVNNAPTSVLVSGVRANMYKVIRPLGDPAYTYTPIELGRYGGTMRECIKINPNSSAPDWACYASYPGEYESSASVLASPQMNAICGTPSKDPVLISACSGGQCTSEIFMFDCQTSYPSLSPSRFFNTEKSDLNYGNTIDDPDDLSNQGFSGKYYVTGNYNTALEILKQGRIPVVSIPIFDRPATGGTYTLKPNAEQILNDVVAQYPQLFASGAMISIVDEPFWNTSSMLQGAALDAEINVLRTGIAMMQRKLPGARYGLNLVGQQSVLPPMMDAMKKLLTPTGGVSISLQWLSTDIYISSFDMTERNNAFSAANWFANYMKTTAPFNTMERWLVVQGFAPFANGIVPSSWSPAMENDFKSIMSTMGIAGLNYTGLVVWGWNKASEIDDRFTGKYFPISARRVYQAPVCSSVNLTATNVPASGGTVTAQAVCANDISTYAWTVNGIAFGGNTPSISITMTTNSSTAAINYKVCYTAINIAHTAPVCSNLVQAGASTTTLPAAPAISSVTPGNGSVTVAFTPGALGSGTLVRYTAACGSVTATGSASPVTVTGLTNGTAYTCRVQTTSSVGSSSWSALSGSVTPTSAATLPAAPAISSVVAGNANVKVTFNPGALGSGTLVRYTASCGSVTFTGSASPITVTGLTNGTAYTCRVQTTSSVGSSPWSANSASVTPTAVVLPAAPTISSVTAGNGAVTVAFNPGALGSGTLVRYTASCGSVSVNGSASPIVVTGLTNGTAYTCRVQTTSSAGTGAWSAASASVTPTLPPVLPSAPTIGTAVGAPGQGTVYFTPGALGSGSLVNYTAACGGVFATGLSSPITVTGLPSGTPLFCEVKTITTVGASPWSNWTSDPIYP